MAQIQYGVTLDILKCAVPLLSARLATLGTHGTHCGQVRVRGCNLTGKGLHSLSALLLATLAASCSMTSSVDARFELRVSCCWMVAQ